MPTPWPHSQRLQQHSVIVVNDYAEHNFQKYQISFFVTFCGSFCRVANSLICSFAHSLFRSKLLILKRNHEQFAQVTHDERATVSYLLRLLMTKRQPWAICSGSSWQLALLREQIAVLQTKNEWIAQKTDKRFRNPVVFYFLLSKIISSVSA